MSSHLNSILIEGKLTKKEIHDNGDIFFEIEHISYENIDDELIKSSFKISCYYLDKTSFNVFQDIEIGREMRVIGKLSFDKNFYPHFYVTVNHYEFKPKWNKKNG